MAKITTVIDIGSNSVRMAIFERTSQFGFVRKFEQKSRVRISENSYENGGFLQDPAIFRTIEVLKNFYEIARAHKSRKILCVATSAVRDAPNSAAFLALAKKHKIFIKILPGEKEAYFGALSCANLMPKKDAIMVDIGGGSSEFALIKNGQILEFGSINLGTIRLKELFLDKNLDERECRAFISQEIKKIPAHFKAENIFGVGGTIRALAKLIIKQSAYSPNILHGFCINLRQNQDLIDKIIRSKRDRLSDLGINDERVDNIQGGLLILTSLCEFFRAKNIIASGVGVREGVFLADMLRTHRGTFPNEINPCIMFLRDCFLNEKFMQNRKKIAKKLFLATQKELPIKNYYEELFLTAAQVCEIGATIDFYNTNRHSAMMALNMLRYGFSHKQRIIISLLIEFSDKKLPKDQDLARFSIPLNLNTLQIFSFLLAAVRILQFCGEDEKFFDFSLQNFVFRISGLKNSLTKERLARLSLPKNFGLNFD